MEGGLIRRGRSRSHLSSNIARIVVAWRARPEVITGQSSFLGNSGRLSAARAQISSKPVSASFPAIHEVA
jgi:hypothetical protein